MCCGGKRQQLRATMASAKAARSLRPSTASAVAPKSVSPEINAAPASSVYFQYVGQTGLTIVSPNTGKRYRFDHPGDQLAVDPRDQALLLYVPNLRHVRIAPAP